jgi:hypothetical protein
MIIDYILGDVLPIPILGGTVTEYDAFAGAYISETYVVADNGAYWYQPSTNLLFQMVMGVWVDSGKTVTVTDTEPTGSFAIGTFWYSASTTTLYYWNGTAWVAVAGILFLVTETLQVDWGSTFPISPEECLFPLTQTTVHILNPVFPYALTEDVSTDIKLDWEIKLYDATPVDPVTLQLDWAIQGAATPVSVSGKFVYQIKATDAIECSKNLIIPWVIKADRTRYGLVKSLQVTYGIPAKVSVTKTHKFNWGQSVPFVKTIKLNWGVLPTVSTALLVKWSQLPKVTATLQANWGQLTHVNSTFNAKWSIRTSVISTTGFSWSIDSINKPSITTKFSWAIQNNSSRHFQEVPILNRA